MSSDPTLPAILVAEDDPNDFALLEHALAEAGSTHPLVVFGNGAELIEHLRQVCHPNGAAPATLPRLLLLDLHIPQVDGCGVIAWVRRHKELAGLRIVVASGSGDSLDAQRAESLGVEVVMTKPLPGPVLRAELRRLAEPRIDHAVGTV